MNIAFEDLKPQFIAVHLQHPRYMTIGCVNCDRATTHTVKRQGGKTVYTCTTEGCGREIVREWEE